MKMRPRLKQRVKKARGRKASSTEWLRRHINDPYVVMAKEDGYRSRAAYKLIDIDNKYSILKGANYIVDLGCAPGSWLQVAMKFSNANRVVGIDLKDVEDLEGADVIKGDFLEEVCQESLEGLLEGCKADLVMSDMAANSCGDKLTDHLRVVNLVEAALLFSRTNLREGGSFVAKLLRGGEEQLLVNELRGYFSKVSIFKPKASYQNSTEIYLVALGYSEGDE